jgi:hypothetical protein
MPQLDVDNNTPRDRQLCFWIVRTLEMKEVIPQIKLMVNPHVSLIESRRPQYEGPLRGSGGVARGHNAVATSGGTGVKA